MAVTIRLRRTGAKKKPAYRIIVADSRSPRDGRFIENIGYYLPQKDRKKIEISLERFTFWKSRGAQPSDTVRRLVSQYKKQAESATL